MPSGPPHIGCLHCSIPLRSLLSGSRQRPPIAHSHRGLKVPRHPHAQLQIIRAHAQSRGHLVPAGRPCGEGREAGGRRYWCGRTLSGVRDLHRGGSYAACDWPHTQHVHQRRPAHVKVLARCCSLHMCKSPSRVLTLGHMQQPLSSTAAPPHPPALCQAFEVLGPRRVIRHADRHQPRQPQVRARLGHVRGQRDDIGRFYAIL